MESSKCAASTAAARSASAIASSLVDFRDAQTFHFCLDVSQQIGLGDIGMRRRGDFHRVDSFRVERSAGVEASRAFENVVIVRNSPCVLNVLINSIATTGSSVESSGRRPSSRTAA